MSELRPQRPFKVLALDGGGYRGLYTACVLREIEAHNGSLSAHFDLLCGTSIGGLIALGLAAGRSAADAVRFFEERGSQIFPRGSWLSRVARAVRQTAFSAKYNPAALEAALVEWLGDASMASANSYLCIPALDFTRWRPVVLKTDHDSRLTRDSAVLMRHVARATSAAPFYFPAAAVPGVPGQFLDGGLWANNPALIGLTEALGFFVGPEKPYDGVEILSIGTVDQPPGRSVRKRASLALRDGLSVFRATLTTQEQAVDSAVRLLATSIPVPIRYVRIPSPTVSADQANDIGLDVATFAATETLRALGHERGHTWNKHADVTPFFSSVADPPRFRTPPTPSRKDPNG